MDTSVKRGDIYYADLSPVVGSEQGGVRPVLIVQNDTGNRYSPTVIAAAIGPLTLAAAAFAAAALAVRTAEVAALHTAGAAAHPNAVQLAQMIESFGSSR